MSIRPLICFVAATAIVTTATSTDAFAQRGRGGWNQLTRFLGGGHSAGYHWRTPGPGVGYYNPYSHHNSTLRIGGYPQGSQDYIARLGYDCRQDYGRAFDEPSGFQNYNYPYSSNMAPSIIPNTIDAQIDDDDLNMEELNGASGEAQSILDDPTSGNGEDLGPLERPAQGPVPAEDMVPTKESGEGAGGGGAEVDETSLWPGFFEFGKAQRPPNRKTNYGRPMQYRNSQAPPRPIDHRHRRAWNNGRIQ